MSAVFFVMGGEMMYNVLSGIWSKPFAFFELEDGNTTDIIKANNGERESILKNNMNNYINKINNIAKTRKADLLSVIQTKLERKISRLEYFEKELASNKNYSKFTKDKEKVTYWTNQYFGFDSKKEEYRLETCIKVVLLSKEFASFCVSTVGDYSTISRNKFYSGLNSGNTGKKKNMPNSDEKIIKDMNKYFESEDFDNSLEKMFKEKIGIVNPSEYITNIHDSFEKIET